MQELQEGIGLLDVLGGLGEGPAVEPADGALPRGLEADRVAGLLEADGGLVRGLANDDAVDREARFRVCRRSPELLDPAFSRNRLLEEDVIDLLHFALVLERVEQTVRGECAGGVEPQADADQQRLRAALHLAFVFLAPERAVGELVGFDAGLIVAPGDRLRPPAVRHEMQLAVPGPGLPRGRQQGGQDGVDLEPVFLERSEQAEVEELPGAVVGRLAEVEALALGRLQPADLLARLRERGGDDLDPGRPLELRDHRTRQLVVPIEDTETAGGGLRAGDVPGPAASQCACGDAGAEEAAAR